MAKKIVVEKVVEETKVAKSACSNCTGQGEQCSVCTPVFIEKLN